MDIINIILHDSWKHGKEHEKKTYLGVSTERMK